MKSFYFYHASISQNKPSYMVCFYSGTDISLEEFCNELVSQFKSSFFTRSIVFVTPSFNKDDVSRRVLNSTAQSIIRDRINSLQELDFHVCFINRDGSFDLDIFEKIEKKLTRAQMEKFIDYGLYNIINIRNLIVEAHSNIHFIKPSGKHSEKFIDVKNLLERAPEVSFIAACLLKFLPEKVSRIYVDTSGIYSLAYSISDIIRKFDNSSEIISIDSFGSYGGIEQYNFSSDHNTVVIISASTSNDLLEKLKRYPSLDQASILSLITTKIGSGGQKVLVDFDRYRKLFDENYFRHFESYDEQDCPLCIKEQSIPIPLDKRRFVFEAPRTDAYLPRSSDSDANLRDLIGKYKKTDAFRCLFDGVDGTKRPTPEYFIDVSKVIKTKPFKELVRKNIQRYFPLNADWIICCKDKGAKELAEFVLKEVTKLGIKVDLLDGKVPETKKTKKGIVVVAGSLESGKSLLNISRALRRFHDIPITYIVGFAKYNSEGEFKKLQMDLKFSEGPCGFHQFHTIEQILLPINEHKEHSWEKEIELLKILEAKHSSDKKLLRTIELRSKRLKEASSSTKKGLGRDLFMPSPAGKHLVLGKTFAFWNKADNSDEFYHHATVYFTVSSVLQRLRTVAKAGGHAPLGRGYIIRQLDPLLFDRFNEGVIQASILRSAKSRELDYSADDAKSRVVGSLIERMLQDPEAEDSNGLPEFLFALCIKRLQVKKDHLLGFDRHRLIKDKHPMVWMLAEHVKDTLLNNGGDDAPLGTVNF